MAQTAMQTLFTNLESIDIKVPQGIKDIYLQMEKEQRVNSQMDMFHHINNMPYGLDYLTKRDSAEIFAEQYGSHGSPDTSPNTQNK